MKRNSHLELVLRIQLYTGDHVLVTHERGGGTLMRLDHEDIALSDGRALALQELALRAPFQVRRGHWFPTTQRMAKGEVLRDSSESCYEDLVALLRREGAGALIDSLSGRHAGGVRLSSRVVVFDEGKGLQAHDALKRLGTTESGRLAREAVDCFKQDDGPWRMSPEAFKLFRELQFHEQLLDMHSRATA